MDRERRGAAKLGKRVVEVSLGRGWLYDLPAMLARQECHACGGPAPAWPWSGGSAPLGYGMAYISDGANAALVRICEACFNNESVAINALIRKYLGNPDLEVVERGECPEIFDAIVESGSATNH